MSSPTPIVAVVGAAVALGGAACARTEPAGPAAPSASAAMGPAERPASRTLEPCRLLSDDEASVFLGGSATASPAPPDKLPHASSCIWTAQGPLRGLQVMTSTPAQLEADEKLRKLDAHTIEKRFAHLIHSQMTEGKAVPIHGFGDGALWAECSQQLWIMKRNQALITISFHGQSPTPQALDKCKGVATRVLARL